MVALVRRPKREVLDKLVDGIKAGASEARRAANAEHAVSDLPPVYGPVVSLDATVNGKPFEQPVLQTGSSFSAGHFGHTAQQPQQPARGPAPSNTPSPK